MADGLQYAVGPDGMIIQFDPHNSKLKPGWRMATQRDFDALLVAQGAPEPNREEEVTHESVIELTSE